MSQDNKDTEVMRTSLENQYGSLFGSLSDTIEQMYERGDNLNDIYSRATVLSEQTTTKFNRLTDNNGQTSTRKARIICCILCSIIAGVIIIILILTTCRCI